MQKLAQEHFHLFVKKKIYLEAYKIIHKQKKQGDTLCLISATNEILVEPIAKFLNIEFIATKLELKNTLFTGKIIPPYCLGKNKVLLMKNFCQQKKLPFDNCSYYGDSKADIYIMNNVNYPKPVNPSKELLTISKKKNWDILTFYKKLL